MRKKKENYLDLLSLPDLKKSFPLRPKATSSISNKNINIENISNFYSCCYTLTGLALSGGGLEGSFFPYYFSFDK